MLQSSKVVLGILSLVLFAAGCQTQTGPSQSATSSPSGHDQADESHDHADDHEKHEEHEEHGGHEEHTDAATEQKVSANLAKLGPEDRKLAEAQKFCAVMNDERLGGMGAPLKLDLKGQTVFVCCKGCRGKALKNPDETLAKVAELKSKNAVHP